MTDEPGSNGITDTLDTSSTESHSDEGSSATGAGSNPGLTTGGSGNNGGNGGGNSGNTIPRSGKFGQITDGSYADNLTMQYYLNGNGEIGLFYCESPEIAKMHDSEMNGKQLFSQKGCLMTCTAKTVSQECDDEIYLRDINRLVDTDADGNLTTEEIAKGIDFFLDRKYGDIYDVIGKDIYDVNISDLSNASKNSDGDRTFVFGNAPDCHGGHWVVLEGYSTNENGQITFSYDGSSDNDIGRTFILGKANQDSLKEIWGITRIQTFTIHRK